MKIEERVIRRPLESGQEFTYAVEIPMDQLLLQLGPDGAVRIQVQTCMRVIKDPHSGNETLVQSWLIVSPKPE